MRALPSYMKGAASAWMSDGNVSHWTVKKMRLQHKKINMCNIKEAYTATHQSIGVRE